jgi:RibD C-terminal domain
MAKLIYSSISSLDGYISDRHGSFEWAAPDEEVHAFVNELERPVGTYLYGRGMYEVMVVWETMTDTGDQPPLIREYAEIRRAADKIVYSRSLETVSSARTRIEPRFDSDSIRQMKATAD